MNEQLELSAPAARFKMALKAIANMYVPSDDKYRVDAIMAGIARQALTVQNLKDGDK